MQVSTIRFEMIGAHLKRLQHYEEVGFSRKHFYYLSCLFFIYITFTGKKNILNLQGEIRKETTLCDIPNNTIPVNFLSGFSKDQHETIPHRVDQVSTTAHKSII